MLTIPPSIVGTVGTGLLIVLVGVYRELEKIRRCQSAQGTAMLIILRDNDTDVPDKIEDSVTPGD